MTADALQPLDGEQTIPSVAPPRPAFDRSKILIAIVIGLVVVAIMGVAVYRHFRRAPETTNMPGVATTAAPLVLPLKMPTSSAAGAASRPTSTPAATPSRVVPNFEEEPGHVIPLRHAAGTDKPAGSGASRLVRAPEDAPIFAADATPDLHGLRSGSLVNGLQSDASATDASLAAPPATGNAVADAKASLNAYRGQLQGVLDGLQHRLAAATGSAAPALNGGGATTGTTGYAPFSGAPGAGASGLGATAPGANFQAPGPALFGTMEQSATARVQAHGLGDRNLMVPKGTLFLCSLATRVISATSGFVGCQTERNVFSENGKVLLIDRGSHLDGEYRIVQVKPGVTRIPVLWTRLRTPTGVVVNLDSPATGALGESGLGGVVDNRWGERLGAALMLSMIQDAIQYETTKQTSQDGSTQVILPNTSTEGGKLAEQVLNTTINIPPLIYQNQGAIAGVYVARDIDFSSVYALQAR